MTPSSLKNLIQRNTVQTKTAGFSANMTLVDGRSTAEQMRDSATEFDEPRPLEAASNLQVSLPQQADEPETLHGDPISPLFDSATDAREAGLDGPDDAASHALADAPEHGQPATAAIGTPNTGPDAVASDLPYASDPVIAAGQKSAAMYTELALFFATLQTLLDKAVEAHQLPPNAFDGLKAVFSQASQDCVSQATIQAQEVKALVKAHAVEAQQLAVQASARRLDADLDRLLDEIESLPGPAQRTAVEAGLQAARRLPSNAASVVSGLDDQLVNLYAAVNDMDAVAVATWAHAARQAAMDEDMAALERLARQAPAPATPEPFEERQTELAALFAQLENATGSAETAAEIPDLILPLQQAVERNIRAMEAIQGAGPHTPEPASTSGADDVDGRASLAESSRTEPVISLLQSQIDALLDSPDEPRPRPKPALHPDTGTAHPFGPTAQDIGEALQGTTGSPFAPRRVKEDTSGRRLKDLPRDTVRQIKSVFTKRWTQAKAP